MLCRFDLLVVLSSHRQGSLLGRIARRKNGTFEVSAGGQQCFYSLLITGDDELCRTLRSAKEEIRELARSGTAVVLSSHLLELIEELAGRLLILDRGRKVFEGTLSEARATLVEGEDKSLEEIFLAVTQETRPSPPNRNQPGPNPPRSPNSPGPWSSSGS